MSKGRRVQERAAVTPRSMSATIDASIDQVIESLRQGTDSIGLMCRATNVPYVRARLGDSLRGYSFEVEEIMGRPNAFVMISIVRS